jgi:predicted DNA-binding transcriptional regulator AlpA
MSELQKTEALVTVKQAAAALGMAPSSLYRLAKSCRVPSYVVGARGRGVRIDIEQAKAALRRQPEEADR